MRKCEYRSHFAQCSRYIKFSVICKELGINQPSFSQFMKGYDWYMSEENLKRINDQLKQIILKIE